MKNIRKYFLLCLLIGFSGIAIGEPPAADCTFENLRNSLENKWVDEVIVDDDYLQDIGDHLLGQLEMTPVGEEFYIGSWPEIDYQDQSDSGWDPMNHLENLTDLCEAYALQVTGIVDSEGNNYSQSDLIDGIVNGLTFWFNYPTNPTCNPNPCPCATTCPCSEGWWENSIGIEREFQKIGVFAYSLLDVDVNGMTIIEHIINNLADDPTDCNNSDFYTGANLADTGGSMLVRGVLLGLEAGTNAGEIAMANASIAEGIDALNLALEFAPAPDNESIQRDYSFHQHGELLYNGGYGISFLEIAAPWASVFSSCDNYDLGEGNEQLIKFVLEGFRRMTIANNTDYSANGRDIAKPYPGSNVAIPRWVMNCLITAATTSEDITSLTNMRMAISPPVSLQGLTGNKHFWKSDYVSHMEGTSYFSSVRMSSGRTVGTEVEGGENLKGYWLPFGCTFIYETGDEYIRYDGSGSETSARNYINIFPQWDWEYIPGVTSPASPEGVPPILIDGNENCRRSTNGNDFVGHAGNGRHSVSCMQVDENYDSNCDGTLNRNLEAKKSWFHFGSEIVALGTDISGTGDIHTTINQSLMRENGSVGYTNGGTPLVLQTDDEGDTYSDVSLISHDGIDYIFPDDMTPVTISTKKGTGNWSDIDDNGGSYRSSLREYIFKASIPHSDDGSYFYIIDPGQQYSDNILELLPNNDNIHAIKKEEAGNDLVGAVFFEDGFSNTTPVDVGNANYSLRFQPDNPCALFFTESNLEVCISSPDRQHDVINLTVTDHDGNSFPIVFNLPDGNGHLDGTSECISFSDFNACGYGSNPLVVQVASVFGGPGTHTWVVPPGVTVVNGNTGTPTFTFSMEGTYEITHEFMFNNQTVTTTQEIVVGNTDDLLVGEIDPCNGDIDCTSFEDGAVSHFWVITSTNPDFITLTSTDQNPSFNLDDPEVDNYNFSGDYFINYTATDACNGTKTINITRTVNMTSAPAPIMGALSPDANCPSSFDFAASFPMGYTGVIIAHLWEFEPNNGTFAEEAVSVEQSPNHVFTVNGSYTVTYTATDECGNEGSTNVQVFVTDVQGAETPIINVTPINNCLTQFTFNRQNNNDALMHLWDFGEGTTWVETNGSVFTHDFTMVGDHSIYYTAIYECGVSVHATIEIPGPEISYANCSSTPGYSFTGFENVEDHSWLFWDGTTSSAQNPIHPYTLQDGEEFLVTYIATDGCGNSETVELEVEMIDEAVVPDADFSFDQNAGCGVVHFENKSDDEDSYLWDFGDGNTSTLENPTHLYAASDNYSVTLTVTNACEMDAVSKTVEDVSIESIPNASFNMTSNCFSYTFTSDQSEPDDTHYWSFGDGAFDDTGDASTVSHTFEEGTFTVLHMIINDCGTDIYTETITVNPTPTPSFTHVVQGCGTLTVDFMSTSSDGTSFSWNFGDGNTSTMEDPTHSYTSEDWYEVTLTVANACGEETTTTSSVSVLYNTPLTASFEALEEACVGDQVTFTNTSTGATSYIWDLDDGNGEIYVSNPSTNYLEAGVYDVTLTAINDECQETSIPFTHTITIGDVPISSFSAPTVDCSGDVTFTSTSSGDITEYMWSFGMGAIPSTQTGTGPHDVTYSSSGDYTATLTTTNACGDSEVAEEVITIVLSADPVSSFTPTITECSSVVTFVNSSTTGQTYLWTLPDGTTLDGFNPGEVDFGLPGEYSVTLKVTDDCGVFDESTVTFNINFCGGEADFTVGQFDCDNTVYFNWVGDEGLTHTWYLNGNVISDLPSFNISLDDLLPQGVEGTYTILHRVTGAGNLQLESTQQVDLYYFDFPGPVNTLNIPQTGSTHTWTFADDPVVVIAGDLVIAPGVTLLIEKGVTVMFCGANSRMVIKRGEGLATPGAYVRLQGKLTDMNNQTWKGVEVEGTGTFPQTTSRQGRFVSLCNSISTGTNCSNPPIIENARIAIQNFSGSKANTGGIIYCTDTKFINNSKSVQYIRYPINVSSTTGYRSRFNTCDFEVNDSYSENLAAFSAFIDLFGVNNIRILGTNFRNNRTVTENDPDILDWGIGVKASAASFKIIPTLTFQGGIGIPCTFENLGYGVTAQTKFGTAGPFTISQADFNGCIVGVRNQGVLASTLLYNDFNLGTLPPGAENIEFSSQFDGAVQSGIIFEGDNVLGFECQQNDFLNTTGTSDYETVGIFCLAIGTENNQIRKNSFDGLSRGNLTVGGNGALPNEPIRGLTYICNDNSNIQDGGFDIDVAQDLDNPLMTSYIRLTQEGEVPGMSAGNLFSDPESISSGTGIYNTNGTTDIITYLFDEDLMNSGNISPSVVPVGSVFISDGDPNTCPTDYCEPPCYPEGVINGIKGDYYNYKTSYDALKAIYDLTPSEQAASTLAFQRKEMDKAAYTVVVHELYDTLNFNQDTLRIWVKNMDNIGAELWLANDQLATGNLQGALSILDAIPNNFALSNEQTLDLQRYREVMVLLQNQNLDNLGESTLSGIDAYKNVGGETQYWVRNILTDYGSHFPPEYVFSTLGNEEPKERNEDVIAEMSKQHLEVFPNPAKDFVIFKLQSIDDRTVSYLEIRDLNGRVVHTRDGIKGSAVVEWKTENEPSGIYFYRLMPEGGEIQSGKVILNK